MVEFLLQEDRVFILLNAHHPFLGFAEAVEQHLTFHDIPNLAKRFSPYYTVLSKKELNQPIREEYLINLAKAELEQLSYWNPKTVGEIIFNFWD